MNIKKGHTSRPDKQKTRKQKRQQPEVQEKGRLGYVKDAPSHHWVYRLLPKNLWPYAQLARWDRPIGWQLLMWPCWWSLMMAVYWHHDTGMPAYHNVISAIWYLLLFFIGSVAMRGAGCTWNDLVDHKIDAKVERTRSRPLPSGQISRLQAKGFTLIQCLLGFLVLISFNEFSIILGLSSIVIVLLYPFMKRMTNWPQLFLGLAFNWGALIGWSAWSGSLSFPAISLYAGSILWTIGYDTIYAHQDKEDDALVGVHSTARLFGCHTKAALAFLYSGFILFAAVAFILSSLSVFAFIGLAIAACHMLHQIYVLDIDNSAQCLQLFKSNSIVGVVIFAGLLCSLIASSL